MTRPTSEELNRAKVLWLNGDNDSEVAAKMKLRPTQAWEVRTYMLRLPPNRKWREEKKGKRKKSPKSS